MSNENGEGKASDAPEGQLTLALRYHPWRMEISGKVDNHELALAMLRQAVEHFQMLARATAALQFQRQAMENERVSKLVMNLKV